jgi:F0F1-type ATP synthase assembly protein I
LVATVSLAPPPPRIVVQSSFATEHAPMSPTPNQPPDKKNPWVQVGRYSQLALLLPTGIVVGWLLGSALDRWLHTSWVSIVGLFLGIAAGMTELIRTVLRDTK